MLLRGSGALVRTARLDRLISHDRARVFDSMRASCLLEVRTLERAVVRVSAKHDCFVKTRVLLERSRSQRLGMLGLCVGQLH